MVQELPQSVLFCCDHNAVRSPMAEGIMKKFYGTDTYVQSAGVKSDLEIDGFPSRFATRSAWSLPGTAPAALTRWSNGAMTCRLLT